LALMDGYVAAKGNGYRQTKRCTINDNVLVQCDRTFTLGAGDRTIKRREGDRSPPQDCQSSGNVVAFCRGAIVEQHSAAERMTWRGNVHSPGGVVGIPATPDAWFQAPMNLVGRDGLSWPQHPAVRGPQLPPLQSKDFGPSWFTIVR